MSDSHLNGEWRWRDAVGRVLFLVRREFLTIWRDKRIRSVLIIPPILQLFLLCCTMPNYLK